MFGWLLNYFWFIFGRVFCEVEGIQLKYAFIVLCYYILDTVQLLERKRIRSDLSDNKEVATYPPTIRMSNMQVAVPESGAVVSANREEESESVEETTLTEVHKDDGNTKMHQKTATFEGQENTSVVEDNKTQQTEASKSVMQQETSTITANKQVFTSKFESSESFSMEETEEYELEG